MLKDKYKKAIDLISPTYYEYEKITKELIIPYIENMNGVFVDCGAQHGIYTVLFSLCASKVICFEPTANADILVKNINTLKGIIPDNIVLERIAVGNKTGKFNDGIWRRWKRERVNAEFEFTTLNDYIKEKIDFIKIDVDSFDFEVLQGATQIMKTFSPMILVELNNALTLRGHTIKEAKDFMIANGYKIIGSGEYGNVLWSK